MHRVFLPLTCVGKCSHYAALMTRTQLPTLSTACRIPNIQLNSQTEELNYNPRETDWFFYINFKACQNF